jgi:hypothetical protein
MNRVFARRVLTTLACLQLIVLSLVSIAATTQKEVDPNAPITPSERGRLISVFVKKWAAYATTTYDVDVHSWSRSFVTQFAKSDPGSLRRAINRTTYEGALSELDGRGQILTDEMVIDRLARLPSNATPSLVTNAFGELTGGLQYTPVQPCRIMDTRTAANGPLIQGEARQVWVSGVDNYLFAGGADNNCGLFEQGLKAAVLNVTVVDSVGSGFSTVYNPNFPRPNASSLNYPAGAILSNSVVSSVYPGEEGSPGYVMLFSSRTAHYVVDIVGYYEVAKAKNLQCLTQTSSILVQPGVEEMISLGCPSGYSVTGGGARWRTYGSFYQILDAGSIYSYPGDTDMYPENDRYISVGFNRSSDATAMEARVRCCRVPGR